MAYCTIAELNNFLMTSLTTATTPSSTGISTAIDMITSRIDLKLTQKGFTLPITNADQLNVLKLYCIYGCMGLTHLIYPKSVNEAGISGQGKHFYDEFRYFLKDPEDYLETKKTMIAGGGLTDTVMEENDYDYFDINQEKF